MRKLSILFIVLVIQNGSLLAQDANKRELRSEEKKMFLRIKGSLEKAPEKDIIELDSFPKPWMTTFSKISEGAVELYNTLTLKYLSYYKIIDGKKVAAHDDIFQDEFLIACTLDEPCAQGLDYYSEFPPFDIEIDSISLKEIAPFATSQGSLSRDNINYSRHVKLDSLVGVDPSGKLVVWLKYLGGYDIVRINRDIEDKKYAVTGGDFTVMYCDNGNVYIKEFSEGLFEDLIKLPMNSEGRLLKNKESKSDNSKSSSAGVVGGNSLLFNRDLVKLSDDDFIANVLAFDTKSIDESKTKMIVILNDLDFDYIYFVFPRYEYKEKELKSTKVEEDVTDVKIHRTHVDMPILLLRDSQGY